MEIETIELESTDGIRPYTGVTETDGVMDGFLRIEGELVLVVEVLDERRVIIARYQGAGSV